MKEVKVLTERQRRNLALEATKEKTSHVCRPSGQAGRIEIQGHKVRLVAEPPPISSADDG